MTETEIERLVVRVIGDGSSVQKMVDDAIKAFNRLNKESKSAETASNELSNAMRRGAQITQSVETNTEKYNRILQEMSDLQLQGAISRQTFNRAMKEHEQLLPEFANATREATSSLRDIGGSLVSTGAAIAAVGAVITGSLYALGFSAVQQAKQFEQTVVSFEAMLGSQQQAQQLLGDLTKFAAATPFTMPTLLQATKMLLQFKVPAKEVMGTLKSIGDVTGGSDAGKVQSMAYAFAQMSSAGRLMGGDLMQMVNAGFNPLSEMAMTTGKSLAVLREEMQAGKISAEMVKEAFASASDRLDLMGKQALTLGGRMSTLDDNTGLFWRSIGEQLLPVVGLYVDIMGSVYQALQGLSPETKKIIAYTGLFAVVIGGAVTAVGGFFISLGLLIPVFSTAAGHLITLAISLGIYTTAEQTAARAAHVSTAAQLKTIATRMLLAPILAVNSSLLAIQTGITASLTGVTWSQALADTGSAIALKYKAAVTWISTAATTNYSIATIWATICSWAATTAIGAWAAVVSIFTGGITLATVAVLGFNIAATAGAAAVGIAIAAIIGLVYFTKQYNDELQRTIDLNEKGKGKTDRRTEKAIASGNTLTGQAKTDYFEQADAVAKRDQLQTQETLNRAKAALKKAEDASNWKTTLGNSNIASIYRAVGAPMVDEDISAHTAKENLTEAQASFDRADSAANKVKEARLQAGGTVDITAEFNAVESNVKGYTADLEKAKAAIKSYSTFRNPTKEQTKSFEESTEAAKKLTEQVSKGKVSMAELEKMRDMGMTTEGAKAIADFDKNKKKTGDPLHDAMVDARLFDPKATQEARDVFTAGFNEDEIKKKSMAAVRAVHDANKAFNQAQVSHDLVGFDKQRMDLQSSIVDMGGTTHEQDIANKERALQIDKAEVQSVDDYIKKMRQANELIGLKGVALEVAKLKQQGTSNITDDQKKGIGDQMAASTMKGLTTALDEQRAMFGLTGIAAEQMKLKLQNVLNPEDLEKATNILKEKEALTTLDELTKKLDEQKAMFGLVGVAAEQMKLKRKGALSPEQLDQAEKLSSKSEAIGIKSKYEDPVKKGMAARDVLKGHFNAGRIDAREYSLALKDLDAQMGKVTGEHEVKFKVTGVDGVAAGSAEALARVNAYMAATPEWNVSKAEKMRKSSIPKSVAASEPLSKEAQDAIDKAMEDSGLTVPAERLAPGAVGVAANNDPAADLVAGTTTTAVAAGLELSNIAAGILQLVEFGRRAADKPVVTLTEGSFA